MADERKSDVEFQDERTKQNRPETNEFGCRSCYWYDEEDVLHDERENCYKCRENRRLAVETWERYGIGTEAVNYGRGPWVRCDGEYRDMALTIMMFADSSDRSYGPTCEYCLGLYPISKLHVDHDDPFSTYDPWCLLDPNRPDNLVLSCETCNRDKGTMTAKEFLDFIASNPRKFKSRGRRATEKFLAYRSFFIPNRDTSSFGSNARSQIFPHPLRSL